jgi:hypothetical protein
LGAKEIKLTDVPYTDFAVVSAADESFFDLLQGMVRSLRDKTFGRDCPVYIFDIGLNDSQRHWLLSQGARLRIPECFPSQDGCPRHLHAFFARSHIPQLFPGHDVYLWIDADAWIQRWEAVELYIEGAMRLGFAVTPENDPAYDREAVLDTHRPSFEMFGADYLKYMDISGPVNAGVFAGRANAPHWQAWRDLIEGNISKANSYYLLFLLDQTALSITCGQFETSFLPTVSNWLCHQAKPMISRDGSELIRPLPPHEALGIVHQTDYTKRRFLALSHEDGTAISRALVYRSHSLLPADDYVSPGLQTILLSSLFPNMVRGDRADNPWPWLRRDNSHPFWVDRRMPPWGFINYDEAHILYNMALKFRGKQALEIGCLMGWSACHIAAAGVDLDIVDPLLEREDVFASVQKALLDVCPTGRVSLFAQSAPDAVHHQAKSRPGGWSFFFIDGNHDGEAPLNDVKACLPYATSDCAMVFHDLASPDVTNAVLHLKGLGWKIRVYHTAQIMAVAYRGDVRPVAHQPDPRMNWTIPPHVMPLLT